MFDNVRRIIAYGKNIFERALVEKDLNSRLVFMGTFLVTSFLMLVHTAIYAMAFLTHGKTDPSYPTILGVLAGGHGVNGIARFFTKKSGGDGGSKNGNGNGNGSNGGDQKPDDPDGKAQGPAAAQQ